MLIKNFRRRRQTYTLKMILSWTKKCLLKALSSIPKFHMLKAILQGLATYFPPTYKLGQSIVVRSTGGAISPLYCYSLWLRHLVMAHENELNTWPHVVAEVGPGDSLGVGLSALLSGAEKYWAFDVVEYADIKKNIEIFDHLVKLFKERRDIPDENEFPRAKPYLKSYKFPHQIMTKERLDKVLSNDRIESVRDAILRPGKELSNNIQIAYFVPWNKSTSVREESVDMIYSQAVLEHVDNLAYTYKALHRWLKVGGFMSHQIDFRCHGIAKEWNGHWAYSDFIWRLIRGKLPYLLNRQPHSVHINLLNELGFKIVCDVRITKAPRTEGALSIKRQNLALRFKNMSEEDFTTRGALIQSVKKLNALQTG